MNLKNSKMKDFAIKIMQNVKIGADCRHGSDEKMRICVNYHLCSNGVGQCTSVKFARGEPQD